jgi:hypothetical protein
MKANELRIGNYYNYNGEILRVEPSVIEDLCDSEEKNWCKPIPLTEEWLLKFGFEKQVMNYSKNIDLFGGGKKLCFSGDYLYIIDSEKQNTIPTDVVTIWNKDVKKEFYVHQLQNLYFSLMDEELTIKEGDK